MRKRPRQALPARNGFQSNDRYPNHKTDAQRISLHFAKGCFMTVYLHGLSTALAPYCLAQSDVRKRTALFFGGRYPNIDRLMQTFDTAGRYADSFIVLVFHFVSYLRTVGLSLRFRSIWRRVPPPTTRTNSQQFIDLMHRISVC